MGSNGSGKSTLIEAVSWALFGNRSETRTGKEGIRRSGAGPHEDCAVEIEFELAQVRYRLRRSLRGKDLRSEAELVAGGAVIAKSDKAVTQKVEQILGMDYRAFFISVFARQKDLSALSVLAPAERKKLIMRMLQLDVLQEVVDDVRRDGRNERQVLQSVNEQLMTSDGRSRKEVISEEVELLDGQIADLDREMEEANEAIRSREAELEAARGRKEWTDLKDEEYRRVERRVLDRAKEVEEGHRTVEVLEGDVLRIQERLTSLPELERMEGELEVSMAQKESMDEQLGRHERRKGIAQNIRRINDEKRRNEGAWTKAKDDLTKLKSPRDRLSTVISTSESLHGALIEKGENMARLGTEAERLRRETEGLDAKTKELDRMGPDSVCPTCERPLGEHHHHLVAKFGDERREKTEKLRLLEGDLRGVRDEVEQIKRRKDLLEDRKRMLQDDAARESALVARVDGYEQRSRELDAQLAGAMGEMDAMGEVAFDPEAYRTVRDKIAALKPQADKAKALRGEGSRLPDLNARLSERKAALTMSEGDLARAKAELAGLGYGPGDLKKARDGYEAAFHAREAAYAEVSRKATSLELASGRLADRKAALADLEEKEMAVAERAAMVERLATLEQVMTDFKRDIMEKVVPTLAEVSSQFFTDMTDSRYGGIELDEDYEMQIYDGGERHPLSRFSGGEGDLANLSLRLAISRLLADRSGNDINFLILDEIFGSQDQTRKRNIMATLNRLERQFHQIILISHIDDTKDLMNNVITVKELEDGTSTVECG